jgi:hypothetical protein
MPTLMGQAMTTSIIMSQKLRRSKRGEKEEFTYRWFVEPLDNRRGKAFKQVGRGAVGVAKVPAAA